MWKALRAGKRKDFQICRVGIVIVHEMNANESNRARVGDLCANFQRHKVIALARHVTRNPFACNNGRSFRATSSANLSRNRNGSPGPVIPAMSRIENDSLNLANTLNTMRSYQGFDGLGYVRTGNQILSILFDNGKHNQLRAPLIITSRLH